jgi:hypothetical protein
MQHKLTGIQVLKFNVLDVNWIAAWEIYRRTGVCNEGLPLGST